MIATAFEILASLFQSIVTIWFISRFNNKRYFGENMPLVFTLVLFSITLVGDFLLPGFNALNMILLFTASFVYAVISGGKNYPKAIISCCIIYSIIMLLGTMIYAIVSATISDFDIAIHGSESVIRCVYLVVVNLSVFVTSKFILSVFAVNKSLDVKTSVIMFVTSAITLAGLCVTTKLASMDFAEDIKTLLIILTTIFITINIILYSLVGQIQKLQQRKYELQLLNEKQNFEQSRLKDAEAIWESIRKMRHDMKQHFAVIQGYLQDGKAQECLQYVNNLVPDIDHIGNIIRSDNKVLDYLINSKLSHLEDTQVIISGVIGDLSDIADIDLSCMIGNILDNAVEAIKPLKEKRIELLFAQQNSNRIIICQNTITESVLQKNKFLNTTKSDVNEHGLGHKIVANIAEKYGGMVNYFEERDMFGVQIILPRVEK